MPARTSIVGAEDASSLLRGDGGIDGVRLTRADAHADTSDFAFRKALVSFSQLSPAVGALEEPAFRTSCHEAPVAPLPLVRCGIEHVRIARVHDDVCDSGVLADVENLGPALAASCVLKSPRSSPAPHSEPRAATYTMSDLPGGRAPRRCVGSRSDPCASSSCHRRRFVDAVAPGVAPGVEVLTGADPDHVRVRRRKSHVSYRGRPFLLEHRFPGDAAIVVFHTPPVAEAA